MLSQPIGVTQLLKLLFPCHSPRLEMRLVPLQDPPPLPALLPLPLPVRGDSHKVGFALY